MQLVHGSPNDEHVTGSLPELDDAPLDEATLPTPDGPTVAASSAPPLPLPMDELPPPPSVPLDEGRASTKTVEQAVASAHTMGAKVATRMAISVKMPVASMDSA